MKRTFLNPGNGGFQTMLNSDIYVDKTGLLSYTNRVIGTDRAFICNSRPRRFGKSVTANMLAAYYSRGCDSKRLFANLDIGNDSSFGEHLNQYDVLRIDVQWCCMDAGSADGTVSYIVSRVLAELKEEYPDIITQEITTIPNALSAVSGVTGRKCIIIIDEWDFLIRDEAENEQVQEEYIKFLRGLFKGIHAGEFIHLAYLTGILPIKKLRTQSALNNFEEFTMLSPGALAPYIGFTEGEVRTLCNRYGRQFKEVGHWYDGYLFEWMSPVSLEKQGPSVPERLHVYNPMAVVEVMRRGIFESYWSKTGTYDSIIPLINMNFDGLKSALIEMLAGEGVRVKTTSYQNDMVTFKNKDDVLTLLIHLGYLAYDSQKKSAFVPNEEIRSELIDAVESNQWNELIELQQKSGKLLRATWNMDGRAVAEAIEEIHSAYVPAITYNNENSLSSVLGIAYLSAMQYYFKPIRELPAGRGFADFVFLPKKEYADCPALVVELKWNRSAEAAIEQIRQKKYVEAIKGYAGEVLLVGINYDKKSKTHDCVIEKLVL